MWAILVDMLWGSELVRWAVGGIAMILAAIFFGKSQKRRGRKELSRQMEIKDHENADQIRDNVERNLSDELRKHEGRGYRDN